MLTPLLLALTLGSEPALVELFSSEGCSSCPPAEALLRAQAASDPSLLVLEFHVDYWNSLGWRDPFSSPAFSERQSHYAAWRGTDQVYTPQAIVDGRDGFIGSDSAKLGDALQRAGVAGKRALSVSIKGSTVEISSSNGPAGELWLAVTEAGLQTQVRRGENEGKTLRHAPLVRSFQSLGSTATGPLSRQVTLHLDPTWQRENLRLVAAVQEPGSGRIVAVGSSKAGPQ
jgi:hypothetical protein